MPADVTYELYLFGALKVVSADGKSSEHSRVMFEGRGHRVWRASRFSRQKASRLLLNARWSSLRDSKVLDVCYLSCSSLEIEVTHSSGTAPITASVP